MSPGKDRRKRTILVFVGYYLPGHRSGGPVRSVANLVAALGDEFDFRLVTCDRDVGDARPYPNVKRMEWVPVGKAQVYYLPRSIRGVVDIVGLLYKGEADLIYLNSFFSFMFSILPLFFMALAPFRRWPTILAPRGEFSPGALRFKALKKVLFLMLVRWLGLFQRSHLIFQASSPLEASDIMRETSTGVRTVLAAPFPAPSKNSEFIVYPRVLTALDLATVASNGHAPRPKAKRRDSLSIAWISRIVRKKNLDTAIDYLSDLQGDVSFTIYGPAEDPRYWDECQLLMAGLPPNVRTAYAGELSHADVQSALQRHDALLFPTLGENYGHVICEALTAGCVVIISDRTPWRDLVRHGVGWDLPLDNRSAFVAALQQCADMDTAAFEEFSARARAYGEQKRDNTEPIEQHRQLFAAALSWS